MTANIIKPTSPEEEKNGAFNSSSVATGVVAISLLLLTCGVVIAWVIPTAHNNAARQQIEVIHTAENTYRSLSNDPEVKAFLNGDVDSFADSEVLVSTGLLDPSRTGCAVVSPDGEEYEAFAISESGTTWTATSSNLTPREFTKALPVGCAWIEDVAAL